MGVEIPNDTSGTNFWDGVRLLKEVIKMSFSWRLKCFIVLFALAIVVIPQAAFSAPTKGLANKNHIAKAKIMNGNDSIKPAKINILVIKAGRISG